MGVVLLSQLLFVAFVGLSVGVPNVRRDEHRPLKEQTSLFERPESTGGGNDDNLANFFNGIRDGLRTSGEGGGAQSFFSRVWNTLLNSTTGGGLPSVSLPDGFGNPMSSVGDSADEDSFMSGFVELLRPWWTGPNVCTREEELEQAGAADGGGLSSMFRSLMTSCADAGNVYKCSMTVTKEGRTVSRTLVYECCHGWARQEGERGCTQPMQLSGLLSTMERLNLTSFLTIIETSGIAVNQSLARGNFTVFAPSNQAINSAPENTEDITFVVESTDDELSYVNEIINGHIVPGWKPSHEWADEMQLATANSDKMLRVNFYSYPEPFITVNCARVTSADNKATNGIVHMVDRVLMPARQTLWQIIGQDRRYSVFSSLVSEQLSEQLDDPSNHFTVLAFTDEAYERLPAELRRRISDKDDCVQELAHEHVIAHTVCSAALGDGTSIMRNLAGHALNATRADDERLLFEGVAAVTVDRVATNGVLHTVEGAIMLEHMLTAVEAARLRSAAFAELLEDAGLSERLQRMPAATVFVPAALDEFEAMDDEELANALRHHIVEDVVQIGVDNLPAESLAGEELLIGVQQSPFSLRAFAIEHATVGCATVTKMNIRTCNGILHLLDRPLQLPTGNALQVLRQDDELSEFVTLIEMADLSGTFESDNFDSTVFAPTNDALAEELTGEKKAALLADKAKLKAFVNDHVAEGRACCHSLRGGDGLFTRRALRSRAGATLRLGARRSVGGARVSGCDRVATNGVVHAVERVVKASRSMSLADLLNQMRRQSGLAQIEQPSSNV